MQKARRKAYLKAMGIDAWQPRGAPAERDAVVPHAAEAPARRPAAAPIEAPQPAAKTVPAGAVEVVRPASKAPAVPAPPATAVDWKRLQAEVSGCRKCRLCETRTNTVFGVGPENAPLMVVGEGPGADEDAQGEPFVGRAGKLLDEMLKAIGRSRQKDTFIANVVKCRPPNNREPAEDEAEACRGYLEQQLRHVQPKLIVALGRVAAQRLLMTDAPLSRLRGQLHRWGPAGTPLMITYHPAYLLRSPGEKAKSWEDLKQVHKFLVAR